jgi:hypothetical protein
MRRVCVVMLTCGVAKARLDGEMHVPLTFPFALVPLPCH